MNIMPKPNKNFTIIQNDIFNNYPDMSAKSKFMLLQILSKPADWKMNLQWLSKQNSEGIHAVKSSVKEWESNGFLHKFTARDNGRIKEIVPVVCYPPLTRDQAEAHFNEKYKQIKNQHGVGPEVINEPDVCDTDIDEIETFQQENEPALCDTDIDGIETFQQENEPALCDTDIDGIETFQQVVECKVSCCEKITPIINTDTNKNLIKQILRETTTTPAREAEPDFRLSESLLPVPSSSCPPHEILNLIPEQHRSHVVLSLVNKAMVDYPVWEVEEAVAYAADKVRGGSFQFKAYLDKTLKNGWSAGYFDSMQEPNFNRSYGAAWIHPMAKYPNGTVTGDPRMDTNYLVAADFLMDMGVDVDKMCAEA